MSSSVDKLVNDNIRLVYFLYEKLSQDEFVKNNKDDLISEGMLGLVKAAQSFDESKGYKFVTFASRCIQNSFYMFMRKENNHYRKTISMSTPVMTDEDGRVSLEEIIASNDNVEESVLTRLDIKSAVEKLKQDERALLDLKLQKKKQREIAEELGIKQPSVSRKYKKVKEKMRKALDY